MMQHELCTSSHVFPCEEVSCYCWISFPWVLLWRGDNVCTDLFIREVLIFSNLQLGACDGNSEAASETSYRETFKHTGEVSHLLCSAWRSHTDCTSELKYRQEKQCFPSMYWRMKPQYCADFILIYLNSWIKEWNEMNRYSSICSGLNYKQTMVNFIDGNGNSRGYPPIRCHAFNLPPSLVIKT